jgi:hypothetical protein
MANKYASKEDVEKYLGISISVDIDSFINAAERIINQITGRNFVADTTASARLFDGDGSNSIIIDDCVAITKIEVGNDSYGLNFNEVQSSGSDRYFLYPNNYSSKLVPIYKVLLNCRHFTAGMQNNRITAKWGYSAACPDDIKLAAIIFAAGIYNQQHQSGDQIKSESIGNYQVTYNSDKGNDSWADFENAKMILEYYRKLNI